MAAPEITAEDELPVRISVGERAAQVGTITLDPSEPALPQIAEMLRAVADEMDKTDEDTQDTEDGED